MYIMHCNAKRVRASKLRKPALAVDELNFFEASADGE